VLPDEILDPGDSEDIIAPTTTAEITGVPGDEGGYRHDPGVTVTLTAEDNEGGSGVLATRYRLTGDTAFADYSEPIQVTQPGEYTLTYYSLDCTLNRETEQTLSFLIEPECEEGEQRLCPSQEGVCGGSVETCENGLWTGCDYTGIPDYEAGMESACFDSLDNDCDGFADLADTDCPRYLDVDRDGFSLIDTDLVFIYRCLAGIDAVPDWYRAIADFPPDQEILDFVTQHREHYDVDADGVVMIDTDLVFIYRCMVPLPAVPEWYRDIQEFPPDEEICGRVTDLLTNNVDGQGAGAESAVEGNGFRAAATAYKDQASGGYGLVDGVGMLKLGCAEAQAGGREIVVPVNLDTARDLTRLTFTMAYDPEELEPVAVRRAGRAVKDPEEGGIDPEKGTVMVSVADLSAGTVIPAGTGRVLEAVFRVREGTDPARAALSLSGPEAYHGPLSLNLLVQNCRNEDPAWAPPKAEASVYGEGAVRGSTLLNLLTLLLIPAGVVVFLKGFRRKR